jgi:hypothetical protein
VGRRAGAAASRQSAANCAGNSNGGFLPKAATRKAAKRHRKLAGDNVPGERENRIASRSDDGKCAMIPPSLQDGFYFGRCNPARCAGLISGCPCRDERGAGRTHEAGRRRKICSRRSRSRPRLLIGRAALPRRRTRGSASLPLFRRWRNRHRMRRCSSSFIDVAADVRRLIIPAGEV